MSFALPKNVPSFDSAQRPFENTIWRQAGTLHQNGDTDGRIGNTLSGIFESKEVLPMYKDKPYTFSASRRNRTWFRRQRTWLGLLLGLLGLLYLLGAFSTSGPNKSVGSGHERSRASRWNWIKPVGVNNAEIWESRREKVKEAFALSWDSYAQYAWGMLIRSLHKRFGVGHPTQDVNRVNVCVRI